MYRNRSRAAREQLRERIKTVLRANPRLTMSELRERFDVSEHLLRTIAREIDYEFGREAITIKPSSAGNNSWGYEGLAKARARVAMFRPRVYIVIVEQIDSSDSSDSRRVSTRVLFHAALKAGTSKDAEGQINARWYAGTLGDLAPGLERLFYDRNAKNEGRVVSVTLIGNAEDGGDHECFSL